jgi:hypothetical protein
LFFFFALLVFLLLLNALVVFLKLLLLVDAAVLCFGVHQILFASVLSLCDVLLIFLEELFRRLFLGLLLTFNKLYDFDLLFILLPSHLIGKLGDVKLLLNVVASKLRLNVVERIDVVVLGQELPNHLVQCVVLNDYSLISNLGLAHRAILHETGC